MQGPDKNPNAPAAAPPGQVHGDSNFRANLFNQQIIEELNNCSVRAQFRKWLKNKGIGLVQDVAGKMPGQCDKDET